MGRENSTDADWKAARHSTDLAPAAEDVPTLYAALHQDAAVDDGGGADGRGGVGRAGPRPGDLELAVEVRPAGERGAEVYEPPAAEAFADGVRSGRHVRFGS